LNFHYGGPWGRDENKKSPRHCRGQTKRKQSDLTLTLHWPWARETTEKRPDFNEIKVVEGYLNGEKKRTDL